MDELQKFFVQNPGTGIIDLIVRLPTANDDGGHEVCAQRLVRQLKELVTKGCWLRKEIINQPQTHSTRWRVSATMSIMVQDAEETAISFLRYKGFSPLPSTMGGDMPLPAQG